MKLSIKVLLSLTLICIFYGNICAQGANQVSLNGKIVDSKGQPVSGANVQLYKIKMDKGEDSWGMELIKEMLTTEDGNYTLLAENAADEVRNMSIILAKKEKYSIGWKNIYKKAEGEILIELGEPNVLAGIVVDEANKPVADVQVSLMMIAGQMNNMRFLMSIKPIDILTAKTDEQGKFSFNYIPNDVSAEFILRKPGRAEIVTMDALAFTGGKLHYLPGQTDIKLTMPMGGKIEGKVLEKNSGKPVGGLSLMLGNNLAGMPMLGTKSILSQSDGTFSFDQLNSGVYYLRAASSKQSMAEWVSEPLSLTVESGKTLSDVNLMVSKGGVLEVAVKDAADNKPIKDAHVNIMDTKTNQQVSAVTDANGVASIRLSQGEFRLDSIFKKEYSSFPRNELLNVENNKTTRFEVRLEGPRKISGKVFDDKGQPVEGVSLKICPMGSDSGVKSDVNGIYEISWNPQMWGLQEEPTFYVVARKAERNLAAAAEIEEGAKKLDIKLQPGYIISGKVADANGKEIPQVNISVMLYESRWGSYIEQGIKANEKGIFIIKAIPFGHEYGVEASADGFGRASVRVNPDKAANNQFNIEQLLLPIANLSVSGVVVDVNDKPVGNAHVNIYGQTQPQRNTQTDAKGRFTIDKVCAGELNISAYMPIGGVNGYVRTEGGAKDIKVMLSNNNSGFVEVVEKYSSLVGKPLPELKNFNIDMSAADSNDKNILVCFFDINQRPSRHLINELAKQAEQLKQKGVTVVIVQSLKADEAAVSDWVKKFDIHFKYGFIADDFDKKRQDWGIKSLPWLILTDRKHAVTNAGFAIGELEEKIKAIEQK